MDPRIKKLRDVLRFQIEWYEKNKHDPDRVYDELFCEFNDLSRGQFVELLETVLADDDFVYDEG